MADGTVNQQDLKTVGEASDEFLINDGGTDKKLRGDGLRITQSQITDATPTTIIYKAEPQTVTGTTSYQDDDHIVFPLATNKKYVFLYVFHVGGGSVADFKYTYIVPSGATGEWMADLEKSSVNQNTAWGGNRNQGTSGDTDDRVISGFGYVETAGTAGDLQFQFANFATTSENSIHHKGGHIRIHEVG